MKLTLTPDDYEVVEDRMAPLGGRIEVKDHIEVSTSERVEVERGEHGKVLAVRIVPARGPCVGVHSNSSSVVAKCAGPLYRRGSGDRRGRRAPRRLPQV